MAIKVAITDDHPLAISGIGLMLSFRKDIVITGTYHSAAELMEGLTKEQPDVLLLDILLPDRSGHELAAVITKTYPDVRIVALTSLDAPAMVKRMMQQGCLGYLLKGTDQQTLIQAVDSAYERREFIEPSLKEHLLQNMIKGRKTDPVMPLVLTKREKEILQLIVTEHTTQQMADKLFISHRTAETHRLSIMKKLEVKNTAGLVLKAIQLGLIGEG